MTPGVWSALCHVEPGQCSARDTCRRAIYYDLSLLRPHAIHVRTASGILGPCQSYIGVDDAGYEPAPMGWGVE